MKFSQASADVYVPSGGEPAAALARVTHLCVAAHQDDIEILAFDGICDCLDAPAEKAFGGVVVTNGAGSPRTGTYSTFTDEQMQVMRRQEQRRAAELGGYTIQVQLAHPSAAVKRPGDAGVAADLAAIFDACSPEVVYLHQPADKHDTHVAVFLRCLQALRALPPERRPKRVLGAEVWRDLDWLVEADKVALDTSAEPQLAVDLLKVFDSQISGGKRYDLAEEGLRHANATYFDSHTTDSTSLLTFAMDLTPLMADDGLDILEFTLGKIAKFAEDVRVRLGRRLGR
jgi:LmbE family N-acetylglucosaminyl deacetylase